jgi:hypothetical protein
MIATLPSRLRTKRPQSERMKNPADKQRHARAAT